MKKAELGVFGVAFMFIGTILGAGYASGREVWQFFGVFGKTGFIGIGIVTVMFMAVGLMSGSVARMLNTNDLGKIIVPGENRFLKSFAGNFMAALLFIMIVTMSAAGGALSYQQFGQSRALGGAVVVILVIITVIGEFERVSGTFRFVLPVLMAIVIFTSAAAILKSGGVMNTGGVFKPSPLAANWPLAAAIFLSYNTIGIIPIMSTASTHAKSKTHAYYGAALGGLSLGIIAVLQLYTMLTDMSLSAGFDMPMLGFAQSLSPAINFIFVFGLFFAIFSSATGNFYGFTARVIKAPYRKLKIIVSSWIGFALGLVGFTRIVAYLFPVEGFIGFAIIFMLTVNYIKLTREERTGHGV